MEKFEVLRSRMTDQYYFHLKAANGRIILSSEGYVTKQSCEDGVESVKANARLDERYERKDAMRDYTFNLKAVNGKTIGRSETYTTHEHREDGIKAVKRIAPGAIIEDLT